VPWWWTALVVLPADEIYAAVSHTDLPTRGVTCSHTADKHADLSKPATTHAASIMHVQHCPEAAMSDAVSSLLHYVTMFLPWLLISYDMLSVCCRHPLAAPLMCLHGCCMLATWP